MKRIILSIIILIITYSNSISQVNKKIESLNTNDTIFYPDDTTHQKDWIEYDTKPEFPGGTDSLNAFVKRNLKYPSALIKDSIKGRVLIRFSIDVNGIACEAVSLRSGASCFFDKIYVYKKRRMLTPYLPGNSSSSFWIE